MKTKQRTKQKQDWQPPEWEPKLDVRTQNIENPYFNPNHEPGSTNPRRIVVVKNLRESAVETLYARRKLDDAQKQAADKFRAIWERCGGAGSSAMDYTREVVDGGGPRDPISERQVDAGRELGRCRTLLGARSYDLVCKVCGQGYSLSDLSRSNRDRTTAADNLRAALDDLGIMWGLASRPKVKAG